MFRLLLICFELWRNGILRTYLEFTVVLIDDVVVLECTRNPFIGSYKKKAIRSDCRIDLELRVDISFFALQSIYETYFFWKQI